MNWSRYVVEYGDAFAISILTASVFAALVIVLRGFQPDRLKRNVVSAAGILICGAAAFSSLQYLRGDLRKQASSRPQLSGIGRRAPNFVFVTPGDNVQHHFSEFAGKVVVLSVWNTACETCRLQVRDLDELQKAYADQLVVLLVTDQDPQSFGKSSLVGKVALRLGCIHPQADRDLYAEPSDSRPITHVIDATGVIRDTLVGHHSFQQMESDVIRYLPEQVQPHKLNEEQLGQQ